MTIRLGSIGITDEHLALHDAVRRWAHAHCDPSVPRATLDAPAETMPPFWDDLAAQGWLGLHLPEELGGEGYGLVELAVVLEELGRVCAPGPVLPTVLASAALVVAGDRAQQERWLPGLADGSLVGAVGFSPGAPVLGGALADVLVLPAPNGDGWAVVERDAVTVTPRPSLDATRRVATVEADSELFGAPEHRLASGPGHIAIGELAATLVAAEAVGGAAWCVDTAASYAKERVQFGRPIGQFQAVKHRCADMLLRTELARAAAWDAAVACDAARDGDPAAREEAAMAAAVAAALVPDAFFSAAKDCIQVLGGIGYTWEHDAHVYLKRATAMRQLLPGSAARCGELALAGTRRTLRAELPPEADTIRAEVRAFLDDLRTHEKPEWNRRIADAGYLVPYWPRPWGRDAGPVEQLVIDEEFAAARVRRPHLQVGAWVLPTLIAHGTPEQQERWIRPTLYGEILWCQMFSEPGAGSDLASLTTRAERVEGGWLLTGQKVWTTMAHLAHWGICLARTNPRVDKHEGITCFMVDMSSPGLDIRPLRELTGQALFNEVFLDEVFVPDDCVVGGVDNGWQAARTTLANERVSMGSGSSFGPGVEAVLAMKGAAEHLGEVGALVAEGEAIAVLGLRSTLRALSGAEPGPESSLRKLLGVEHEQRVQEVGLALLGPEGAIDEGEAAVWIAGFLGNRALSIAGGTSDVQRNIIAERLLGLPRDP
jgi:alkylation response protein AidB-like acyl-CoA dehydrogenase